jgi:membrane protein implicated in regulation of membrane protease activity
MTELLTLIGALAMVLVGIAIILQIISVEEVFGFIGRSMMALVLALITLCILRGLWLGVFVPWLSAAFESLKTLIGRLLVIIICFIALSLVGRIAFRRFARRLTLRRDPRNGVGYDLNDSKDANN